MYHQDLPLAFSRHATSKLNRFEDLYRLSTFGFRGEALASISSISRLQCISFVQDRTAGSELRIEGGQVLLHEERMKAGMDSGTELVIKDLFFHSPAASVKERIWDILPKARDQVLFSQRFYENNELDLYLIPGNFKAPVKLQYVFINGRYVLDKQLTRVISEALRSSFGQDDFHYLVFFDLPSDCIDVNVHPSKTVIKCLEVSKMISLLTSTIKGLATEGQKKVDAPQRAESAPELLGSLSEAPALLQERHSYNLDGFFSPHSLPSREESLIWLDQTFITNWENTWWAISPQKLLKGYIELRSRSAAENIPLLVSEPFPSKNVSSTTVDRLCSMGFEIEHLGPETLVLRSIPEWMNGFPLKDVVEVMLTTQDFGTLVINPHDWSNSIWSEMLAALGPVRLLDERIGIKLQDLLAEKLR
jgi:DNA mismatch repair protein MutL